MLRLLPDKNDDPLPTKDFKQTVIEVIAWILLIMAIGLVAYAAYSVYIIVSTHKKVQNKQVYYESRDERV